MSILKVKYDATGAGDGSTWEDAYTSISAAYSAATTGDEIEISGGTTGHHYVEQVRDQKGLYIHGSFEAGHTGLVTVGEDAYAYRNDVPSSCSNFEFASDSFGFFLGASLTATLIRANEKVLTGLEITSASGDFVFNCCTFNGCGTKAGKLGPGDAGTASVVFNYCRFSNLINEALSSGNISVQFVSSVDFNQCLFIGNRRPSVYGYAGSADVRLKNCCVVGCGEYGSSVDFVNKSGSFTGTITAETSLILPPWAGNVGPIDTQTNCINDDNPGFITSPRVGISTVIVDDGDNFEHWKNVADMAESHGVHSVLSLSKPYARSQSDFDEMGQYISSGHEIACHSTYHSDLVSLDKIDVTSSQTVPTIEISTTTTSVASADWVGTVLIKEDGVTVETINLSGTYSVNDLISAINAVAGWTASLNSVNLGSDNDGSCLATCLANGEFAASDTSLSMEQAKFWYVEIAEAKAAIEQGIGQECMSWVSPGNRYSEDLQAYLRSDSEIYSGHFDDAGTTPFKICRMAGDPYLSEIDISNLPAISMQTLIGPGESEDAIKQKSNSAGVFQAHQGLCIMPYDHGAAAFSVDEWESYVNYTKTIAGMKILTMKETYDLIVSSGAWTNSTGTTYTRTWVSEWDDKIKNNSSLVSLGVHIPTIYGQTDPWGASVYDKNNIGRDQAAGAPDGGDTPQLLIGGGVLAGAAYI
jgi:hypothetical protein